MALVPFPGQSAPEPSPPDEPERDEALAPGTGETLPDEEDLLDGRMTFLEHLDELRIRLTRAVIALLVGFVIAFMFADRVWDFVFARLTAEVPGGQFIYTEAPEAFFMYIKIAALTGLLIASPYIMWQVWLFIAPGLYAKEKKLAIPFAVATSGLFIGGAAFAHYILFPVAWGFFAGFSTDVMVFTPRVAPAFSLYVKLALSLGLAFQAPVLIFALARMGLVTPRFLLKNFKYAVLIMFVFAAVLTPPDPVSQLLMALPMIALYGVGILVAWVFGRKDRATDAEEST